MTDSTTEKAKKNAMASLVILTAVSFVIDVSQALYFYNSGKKADAIARNEEFKWSLPSGKEMLKTAGAVIVTSLITVGLVSMTERLVLGKENKDQSVKA